VKKYISTDRAHEITGYSVDYIGQLCRSGKLSCTSVDGEWAVDLAHLKEYVLTKGGELFAHESVPTFELSENPSDQSVVIAGKKYITTVRAAQMSSYAQDYIGQLVRAKKVDSVNMRGRWYVHLDSLLSYIQAQENNALQNTIAKTGFVTPSPSLKRQVPVSHQSPLRYEQDTSDLFPTFYEKKSVPSPFFSTTRDDDRGRIYNSFTEDATSAPQTTTALQAPPTITLSTTEVNHLVPNDVAIAYPVRYDVYEQKKSPSLFAGAVVAVAVFVVTGIAGALSVTPRSVIAQMPFVQSMLAMTTASITVSGQ
jgi:hypothetical protein